MSTQFAAPPTPTPTPRHRGLWIGGGAALVVGVVLAVAVVAGGGSGNGAGGGSGQTIDYAQFVTYVDAGTTSEANLGYLDQHRNNFPIFQVSASDCRAAASDLRDLRSHTEAWPAVLQMPMSRAESAFAAAITACYANNLATMEADMTKGDEYLAATQDAFDSHCTRSDQDISRYRC